MSNTSLSMSSQFVDYFVRKTEAEVIDITDITCTPPTVSTALTTANYNSEQKSLSQKLKLTQRWHGLAGQSSRVFKGLPSYSGYLYSIIDHFFLSIF